MAANKKAPPEPERHSAYSSVTGLLGDWVRQGTEGFVAAQKILLDVAAQQNALALSMIRERVGFSTPSAKKVAAFAGEGMKTMLDLQRSMLDFFTKENSILYAGVTTHLAPGPLETMAEVFHRSLDALIDSQNRFLDVMQSQTEGMVSDVKHGKDFEAGRFAAVGREGLQIFLESQRRFLKILQDQIAGKATAAGENAPKQIEFFEMAKRSVDALVETQKHLLDLGLNQVNADVAFARDVFSFDVQPTAFSDVVKKSVDSFVAAQKALADLAAKPRTPSPHDGETRRAAAA